IESREVLEEALEDFQGTILAVSHDRYFLNKLFDKIYWIHHKRLDSFEGNYNYAKEKMVELNERMLSTKEDKKKEKTRRHKVKMKQKLRTDQELMEDLKAIENRIAELENLLMEENQLEVLQQIYKEKEELEEKWEELCNQLEG